MYKRSLQMRIMSFVLHEKTPEKYQIVYTMFTPDKKRELRFCRNSLIINGRDDRI
jgi:hypothetical protein